MFPAGYFGTRAFATRYFCKVGATPIVLYFRRGLRRHTGSR
jgi:hypothetical protein